MKENRDTRDLGLVYAASALIARRRLALGFPRVDAREYWSDGCLGLLRARATFDAARDIRFSTYATTRIRGAILDGIRAERVWPRSVTPPAFASVLDSLVDPRPTPAADAERASIRRVVRAAVRDARLSPAERYAVVRRYWYDERGVTTARRLGVTESAISIRLRRAHAKLRVSLAGVA